MNLPHIIAAYINLNILIITGFFGLVLYQILARLARRTIGARSLLKLHYAILSIVFILLLLYPVLPVKNNFEPTVQIWSAQSLDIYTRYHSSPDNEGYLEFPGIQRGESIDTENAKHAVICFIMALLLIGSFKISYDLYRLFIIKKGSYLIRRRGTVSIYANDNIKVPFSYWLPGMANIIIPTDLLGKSSDYKITLLHELQHHRNGDTKWVYFVWFLRSLCFLNPFIHRWSRLISELQEFACDEVLIDQKKINSQDYASCLFDAAKSSSKRRYTPVCATGLTLMVHRKLLKRRIEKMLEKIPIQLKWHLNLLVVILIFGLMTLMSCALKGAVKDRRITMAQAVVMAERAGEDSKLPIAVNDLVLKELNAYLGTPEGREYIGDSLDRMKNYQKDIEQKISEYGEPMEFLAIPLIESGYQEGAVSKAGAAGLWQFIPSTANKFGLKIDDEGDERLDADASTDAAMRYLSANKRRFNDWQLSVLAYNIGESNVQKTIEKTGSRNVWDISRAFYGNENNYYAKFMAAVIIMKNPDFVADNFEIRTENNLIHFIIPMTGWISSRFGYRVSPVTNEKEFHNGIDIAARSKTPIVATASGIVQKVEFSPDGYGHYIIMLHKNNFQTLYAKCEKILVQEGQNVKSGDIIALCGSSGRSTGPHLHFELRKDGKPVNPEKYIDFH